MLSFGNRRKAEKTVSEWLAHPNEFGVAPKMVKYRRNFRVTLEQYGTFRIHLVDYEMPDGTVGRAFYNPVTWTFLGDAINDIDDASLIVAYAGWLFLVPALQNGSVTDRFISETEEVAFTHEKTQLGLTDFTVTERYRIATSELFEYEATHQGEKVRGAGNTETEVMFNENDPRYHLPAIYFVLGNNLLN